jgi:hypothetical protein
MEAVMVRIVYEHLAAWPEQGPLRVEAQFRGEIPVSPDLARRRANSYLAREVALFVIAGEPMLILGNHPRWRLPTILRLRGFGNLAEVGAVDVDAQTGKVVSLTEDEIRVIRERAHDIAGRLTPSPEAAS